MAHKNGILGGTFNPIHLGHVDLGQQVMRNFQLDKTTFLLAAQPPHKEKKNIIPADIRWKMVVSGLKQYPNMEPSDIELKRDGFSWTIETVQLLKKQQPDNDFYFISGSEGFLKIRSWKEYKKLLKTVPFIIVIRRDKHRGSVCTLLKEEGVPYSTSTRLQEGKSSMAYLFSYESEKLYLSSTLIRGKIDRGEPISGLVSKGVEKIIEEHGLYGYK